MKAILSIVFFFTLQCTCTTASSFLLVCQPQDTMTGLDLASVSESKILRIQEDVILKNTKNAVRFHQLNWLLRVLFSSVFENTSCEYTETNFRSFILKNDFFKYCCHKFERMEEFLFEPFLHPWCRPSLGEYQVECSLRKNT